jgi:hypothetical protein
MTLSTDVRDNEAKKFRSTPNGPVVAVTIEQSNLSSLFDTSTSITYIGEAVRGSLASDPVWKITRIDTTSSLITIQTASDSYNQIWNNRASLIYL